MDVSSYFIENKALFGCYPTNDDILYFEKIGVKYFIDLTEHGKLPPYNLSTQSTLVKYPIPDMKIPTNITYFCSFILHIENILKNLKEGEKIYVHCKGGNGRAGLVVACLLVRYHNMNALDALQLTHKYHSERKNLKLKWRLLGSPQTMSQKNFVIKLFTPFCIYRDVLIGNKFGFVPYSKISVYIPELNMNFDNTYNAYKYIISNIPYASDEDMFNCMLYVQDLKIKQCIQFKNNLINTTFRPIMYCNNNDKYWGVDNRGIGNNHLGKILMQLRDEIMVNSYIDFKNEFSKKSKDDKLF